MIYIPTFALLFQNFEPYFIPSFSLEGTWKPAIITFKYMRNRAVSERPDNGQIIPDCNGENEDQEWIIVITQRAYDIDTDAYFHMRNTVLWKIKT